MSLSTLIVSQTIGTASCTETQRSATLLIGMWVRLFHTLPWPLRSMLFCHTLNTSLSFLFTQESNTTINPEPSIQIFYLGPIAHIHAHVRTPSPPQQPTRYITLLLNPAQNPSICTFSSRNVSITSQKLVLCSYMQEYTCGASRGRGL